MATCVGHKYNLPVVVCAITTVMGPIWLTTPVPIPHCPRRGNINITSEVSSSFLFIQYKRRGVAALLAARYAYKINIPLGEYLRVSYKTNKINQIGETKRMEGSNPRQFEWTHVSNGQGQGERSMKTKGEHERRGREKEREMEREGEKTRAGSRKIYARFVHGRAHAPLFLPEVGLPVGVWAAAIVKRTKKSVQCARLDVGVLLGVANNSFSNGNNIK